MVFEYAKSRGAHASKHTSHERLGFNRKSVKRISDNASRFANQFSTSAAHEIAKFLGISEDPDASDVSLEIYKERERRLTVVSQIPRNATTRCIEQAEGSSTSACFEGIASIDERNISCHMNHHHELCLCQIQSREKKEEANDVNFA